MKIQFNQDTKTVEVINQNGEVVAEFKSYVMALTFVEREWA